MAVIKWLSDNQEQESTAMATDTSAFDYRNDGYIELVLKVMARMCDGQNKHLQVSLWEEFLIFPFFPTLFKNVNPVYLAKTFHFLVFV